MTESYDLAVAITGLSGRFPGAANVDSFWQNVAGGVKSIRDLSDEELVRAGINPTRFSQPNYVKRAATLDGIDLFDASFFGYPRLIAEITDPQHRLFLECVWHAIENAGYDPMTYRGLIGVFAGAAASGYLINNISFRQDAAESAGPFQVDFTNTVDSLATTVSYRLNLIGPALSVQTFCSTSLVAVHMACQSLLNFESDIALAGGVYLSMPHGAGYEHQEGGILSPDGEVRTFDGRAQGSVMGSGVGVVVLKRMEDALADGDNIYAVIRGSAVNNDGIQKVGYTAPGLSGQMSVIATALSRAGVSAESIGYFEAHGTGTPLGDAVELTATIQAFRRTTQKRGYCALGSVKPNIGHLDRAAGIAGLIKTALCLRHRQLPPSLNFVEANAEVGLEESPFYVNTRLRTWESADGPRRAGVSSFGLGGTNAHVVLEEAPEPVASDAAAGPQLLVVSAKTSTALEQACRNLAQHLRAHGELNLADVAYTLQLGRAAFNHRRMLVCRDVDDAIAGLESGRGASIEQSGRDGAIRLVFADGGFGLADEVLEMQPSLRGPGSAGGSLARWLSERGARIAMIEGIGGGAAIAEQARAEVVSSATLESGIKVELQPGVLQPADLLDLVGRLWLQGVMVDWSALWRGHRRRRVVLPGYPFERRRYWLDPPRPALVGEAEAAVGTRKSDISDWFYKPVWRESEAAAARRGGGWHWLVLLDGGGLGEELSQRLEQAGHRVTRVAAGSWPDFSELAASGGLPQGVVHLGSLDAPPMDGTVARFESCRERGFASLLRLGRELGRHVVDEPIEIVVASRAMQAVLPQEAGDAEQALVAGLCKVIGQENVTVRCRSVDVEPVDGSAVAALARECLCESGDPVVAYRSGRRYVQSYAPLRLEPTAMLRDRGVYLITGGLGGIGMHLAEHLARRRQARLVLIGRHAPSAAQRERIAAMEQVGAEVLVLKADVGDAAELSAAVAAARTRFGAVNGVVHAAGVTHERGFAPLQELSVEQCAMQFAAKVYGLYALETALGESPLDFCVLFSSLGAVLGGLGFAAYAAANSFMDVFAHRHNHLGKGPRWTSVNWDTWQLKAAAEGRAGLGATVARYEMMAEEGVQAFEHVLGRAESQIVNSTGDLEGRIRQWVRLESLREGMEAGPAERAGAGWAPSGADYEERIAAVWRQVLGMPEVGRHDNFFEIGGNSLIGLQLIARLKKEFKRPVPAVALFEAPTVSALAAYLRPEAEPVEDRVAAQLQERRRRASGERGEIAIIAMVGRFPGADNVDQFWGNLRDGVESIRRFSDEELLASGVELGLLQDPNYVKARPVLSDVEHFDAALFGYTPREAELMDPQQRLFQECAWEALETAGYDPQRYRGLIGVYGGTNLNMYLMRLASDPQLNDLFSESTVLENDKDALTLNVSYRLNLRGPSVSVQTFCSTSLVASHMACRALRNGDCDLALAGGVSVRVPVKAGYLYQEGDQVSHDGHCRSFDAAADGTTFGDGVAMVVLKRLGDALEDGDRIHAVIKGSAINNDGALKVGYTAPSVVGQAAVVEAALADAGVSAESIDYVEAHGTATRLGDPVEVASLSKAFRAGTSKRQYCMLGSVKPNVGHLDRAAGVSGLIKTVMALEHEELPATLHYERANPEIDFENSPFYVLAERRSWRRGGRPRRACVNSLGVGGTNAHVVIEEAPAVGPSGPSRQWQLLVLSARSEAALAETAQRLRQHLQGVEERSLADAAYTLQVGRRVMEHRRMLVCRDAQEAIELLGGNQPRRVWSRAQKASPRQVAMVFAGVGEHYPGWGKELYDQEAVFRTAVDRCCRLLQPHLGIDLRELLFAGGSRGNGRSAPSSALAQLEAERPIEALRRTALAQPAAFVIDYALAQLWMSWGVRPGALLGYSVGEYVAACLSGMLSLEDALHLVARRAQAIEALSGGAMLAVSLDEASLTSWLGGGVELAAVNSPAACVVAGPVGAIAELQQRLEDADIACRMVEASHAFHTVLLRPAAAELTALAASLKRQPPKIPCLSNVTGDWLTTEQANDPTYWAEHMCRPVRFADGVGRLLQEPGQILLEIGPSAALSSFVRQHPHCSRERMAEILSSLPPAHERQSEVASLLTTLGKLWLLDLPIDWDGFHVNHRRHRVPLPTYPFERKRFWLEPRRHAQPGGMAVRKADIADWFDVPSWKRASAVAPGDLKPAQSWLVLLDDCGVGGQLVSWLQARGQHVVTVVAGTDYAKPGHSAYAVRLAERTDYEAVLQDLQSENRLPSHVVHLWTVGEEGDGERELERGFYSLLALTQALGDRGVDSCRIDVVSSGMQEVVGTEALIPARAAVIGPVKIIAQEYPNFSSRSIDITLPVDIGQLGAVLSSQDDEDIVALRGAFRWVQRFDPMRLERCSGPGRLREGGVYLITGGLGGIALGLAEDLARLKARLVLVGRNARRTAAVDRLEALGAEVLVQQADVTELRQIEAAVQAALERFGTIHGVLHTAGVPGIGLMQLKARETAAAVLRPKVQGTLALARALEGIELDFLVLFSSITSATGGGPGQVDYCAANAFLDAFARQAARQNRPVTAISWGEWQWDAWQEGLQGFPEEVRRYFIANRRHYGISFADGADALRRILANPLPHVFVTTQDLPAMVEGSRKSSAASMLEKLDEQRRAQPRHPRPDIGVSYIAPSDGLEQKIAEIWGRALGIETVGVNDNFFDLGGNSLIGIDVIAKLRKERGTAGLPSYVLYEAPTVGALAAYLNGEKVSESADPVETIDVSKLEEQVDYFRQRAEAGELI